MIFATLDIAHAQYLVSQSALSPDDARKGHAEGAGTAAVTHSFARLNPNRNHHS